MSGRKEEPYQVSVIVYTYNSDLRQTLGSIRSAVLQKGIRHQIIVADDGSADPHRGEIEALFQKLHFPDYRFSLLAKNRGIVENLRSAAALAEGEYIKILSPGDYLAEAGVLAGLYRFARAGEIPVVFGDAVYYSLRDGRAVPLKDHINAPALLYPYESGSRRLKDAEKRQEQSGAAKECRFQKRKEQRYAALQRRNCLMVNDFILGAAVFTRGDIYREYIGRLSGHVRYFEDNALRLMIYDGIVIRHFPEVIMWYEYGSGISTGRSKLWRAWLRRDYEETNRLMSARGNMSRDRKRILQVYKAGRGLCRRRFLLLPEALPAILRKVYFPQRAQYRAPGEFLKNIISIAEEGSI